MGHHRIKNGSLMNGRHKTKTQPTRTENKHHRIKVSTTTDNRLGYYPVHLWYYTPTNLLILIIRISTYSYNQ